VSNRAKTDISVAVRIVSLVQDGLRPLDRTIAAWPAEFRALIWDAVAAIATARAAESRHPVGNAGEPKT